MTAERAASNEDNQALQQEQQALHSKLDDTRDAAAANQQEMSDRLTEAYHTIEQLERRLTREEKHTRELIAAAEQAVADSQQQMHVIGENNKSIDTLQTEVTSQAKEASINAKESALLHQTNEHLQSRCTQLQDTVESLNVKLEKQSQTDGLSHAKRLEALTEQLSILTKKLTSSKGRKE
jgi:hypothetical protein